MKSNLTNCACSFVLLGALASASAQTTWNYFLSDAGEGNSLLTWNVSGSLAAPPGAFLVREEDYLRVCVTAPGIFADSFSNTLGGLPVPDESYFELGTSSIYYRLDLYSASNVPGSGNDTFGLAARLFPVGRIGYSLIYHPGTEFALIPIDYSCFNPGTYQSEVTGLNTPLTVSLTVGVVPEPSSTLLLAVGVLSGLVRQSKRRHSNA